jgi:ferredoxin/flavodoxin---NADP+ reductase
MFKITRKQSFNDDTFLLEFEMPAIAEKARPGQYVDIHLNPDARPITVPVTGTDAEAGRFTIVEQGRDLPTEQLMVLAEGEEVFQIRGPLGSACKFDADGKVVLMAEDLGAASLLWRAREFRAAGAHVIVILGFASKDRVFWQNEFGEVANELYIATVDGSFGMTGRVTGALQAVCETHKDVERIVMIGRLKTMKRGAKIAVDFGIDARVSFDAIRHPVGSPGVFDQVDQTKDVFMFARAAELNAEDVDFDKLIARERAISADASSEEDDGARNASRI